MRRRRASAPTVALSVDELERRARWAGIITASPAFTDAEAEALRMHREASAAWVPQSALRFCWSNADPLHGAGEWSWSKFQAALDADRREIARVVAHHPEQTDRLRGWTEAISALATARDGDRDVWSGPYYSRLANLGYAGQQHDEDNEY